LKIRKRDENMKIEYKSLFLGVALGIVVVFSVLYLLGNVETEFQFQIGDKSQNKDIDIRIEQTIQDGENFTNVEIKGKGDVTKEELEQELEQMLKKQGINREKTKLKVDIEIKS
tara:strand:+ start:64 stop:405 length:342 start_codon:yes stop_codon:yes gene_type:complete